MYYKGWRVWSESIPEVTSVTVGDPSEVENDERMWECSCLPLPHHRRKALADEFRYHCLLCFRDTRAGGLNEFDSVSISTGEHAEWLGGHLVEASNMF